jgi:5-methylcytosine-specific restriction endonuclease McrA
MRTNKVYRVSDEKFIKIATESKTIRQALLTLGLKGKGGNYDVFKNRCKRLGINKFTGQSRDQGVLRLAILDDTIKIFCAKCESRRAVLIKLGLKDCGSNVRWMNEKIKSLSINTSHWLGMGHLKGKTHNWSTSIPLSKILCKNSEYTNYSALKKRLIKAELLKYKCNRCSISTWNNEELSLHLDHINGIKTDNSIENLRLLCPNCHSQTDTYCGRNIGKNK